MTPANLGRIAFLLFILIVMVVTTAFFDLDEIFRSAEQGFKSLGSAGPVVFAMAYGVLGILLAPTGILAIIAGAIFGMQTGAFVVLSGALLAATTGFLCGRFLARQWLDKQLAKNPRAHDIKRAVEKKGFWIVVLVRLSPAVPFNFTSYVLGASRIQWSTFMGATGLGMLPIKLLLIWTGASGSELLAAADPGAWGTKEWLLYGGGTVASVVLVGLIGMIIARSTRRIVRDMQAQP